jgi:hypothetical protein
MERKRIYITVKTYPTLSEKYDELVCTAGISENGLWIRLYPLPFRKLDNEQKYKKYQWIEAEIERNTSDFRIVVKAVKKYLLPVYETFVNYELFISSWNKDTVLWNPLIQTLEFHYSESNNKEMSVLGTDGEG